MIHQPCSRLVPAVMLLTSAALAAGQSGARPADLDPVSRARLPYLHRRN